MHLVWFTPPCEILISIYRNWSDEISRRKQDQAQTSACEVVFYNFNVPLEQVWLFDQLWITNVVMSVAIKLMNQIFVDRRGQKCDVIVYSLKEQLFFYALPVNSSTNNGDTPWLLMNFTILISPQVLIVSRVACVLKHSDLNLFCT